MNAIEIQNVCKSFRDKQVLRDVTAVWEAGKTHGLIGDNGSGKSVLLKCVCGLLPVDAGEVRLFGKKVKPGKGNLPAIGLIIEHPGFLGTLSGYENLRYLAGIRGRIGKQEILRALDTVGLSESKNKRVGKYSLGMRQRLAIAQAIMEDPPLLVMDEPFNGLDRHAVAHIRELFEQLHQAGKTLVLCSHNAADIDLLCDDVYEIEEGRLARREDAAPAEEGAAHPRAAAAIDKSAANPV